MANDPSEPAAQDAATLPANTPYEWIGGEAAVRDLVERFYDLMDLEPGYAALRASHGSDLSNARRKLFWFLCGWLGGPRLFQQHYGPISIPDAHKRFPIGYEERDAWLLCMQRALAAQPFSTELKDYLLAALSIPAERIRQVNAGEP